MVHVTSLFLFASLLLNAASSSFALPLSARNNAHSLPARAIEPVFAREVDALPTLNTRQDFQPVQARESTPKRLHARDIYYVGPDSGCGNSSTTETNSSLQSRDSSPSRPQARDIYYVGPQACRMRTSGSGTPKTNTTGSPEADPSTSGQFNSTNQSTNSSTTPDTGSPTGTNTTLYGGAYQSSGLSNGGENTTLAENVGNSTTTGGNYGGANTTNTQSGGNTTDTSSLYQSSTTSGSVLQGNVTLPQYSESSGQPKLNQSTVSGNFSLAVNSSPSSPST